MLKLDLGIKNFTKTKVDVGMIRDAMTNTLDILGLDGDIEISVVFVGDRRMRDMNRDFRKKDKVTDVLSFGFSEGGEISNSYRNLGEIFICINRAKKQAKEKKKSLKEELALLVSHGVIHLFGIDHERSEKESLETDKIQNEVLVKIFKNSNL